MERKEWTQILNQSRSNYSRTKTKLIIDPRVKDLTVGLLDPLFSNPLSIQNDVSRILLFISNFVNCYYTSSVSLSKVTFKFIFDNFKFLVYFHVSFKNFYRKYF